MKNKKGPLILFVLIVLIVVAAYFGKNFLFTKKQQTTSDASVSTTTMNWAGDGYLGYAFLRTIEIKKNLARKGIALKFFDDEGDYAQRLEKFADKEYDFIVLPINSYIEHGAKFKYPGVIIAAISESIGADAIVGFDDVLPTGKINELNNPDLQIYYTGKSPSSFLLDLTISDFALDEMANDISWRKEVGGSEEVYKMAKKAVKDRSVGDAFVMWEPEVSKAINNLNLKKIWSSDQFRGYIIDVFVFHRDLVQKEPENIKNLLKSYFRTIDFYATRKDEMIKELSKIANIDKSIVENMTENIDWYNLQENCAQMFDIPLAVDIPSKDGLINSIYACSDVMVSVGILQEGVDDPYLLINSSFLEELKVTGIKQIGEDASATNAEFELFSDEEWANLTEIGTMRVKPITFQSGTSRLDYQGEEIVDKVAQMLIHNYPEYRVAIRGHTGRGDEAANQKLSKERADMVRQRLIAVHDINTNRLHAEGWGAKIPPQKKSGENPRAFALRWARVEFVLLEGASI